MDDHSEFRQGRVVALDYGRRRIGMAVSDPTLTIASPYRAFRNSPPVSSPPPELLAELEKLDPARLLVGIPLHMDGQEGEMAAEARLFGRILAERIGAYLIEWDERLSSIEARSELIRLGVRVKKRRKKGADDVMAATLMLRDYLAAQ